MIDYSRITKVHLLFSNYSGSLVQTTVACCVHFVIYSVGIIGALVLRPVNWIAWSPLSLLVAVGTYWMHHLQALIVQLMQHLP